MTNTVRRGDINIAAGGLVGVLMFVLVVSLIKLAVFVLVTGIIVAFVVVMVRGFIQGVRNVPTQPAPYRVEDDPAAQAHRARMRATLGYNPYTR